MRKPSTALVTHDNGNGSDKTPDARAPARSVTRVTARTAKWKRRFLRALACGIIKNGVGVR